MDIGHTQLIDIENIVNKILNNLGEVVTVNGPSFKGHTESRREDFNEHWMAPPGFAIIDCQVENHCGTGGFTFGHSISSQGSNLVQYYQIEEQYKKLNDLCAEGAYEEYKGEFQAVLKQEQERLYKAFYQANSTHNVVILKGHIEPTYDFWGIRNAGGQLDLTTKVRLIKIITWDDLNQIVKLHQDQLMLVEQQQKAIEQPQDPIQNSVQNFLKMLGM